MIVGAFADAEVVAHTRSSLDITDAGQVARAVRDAEPDVIVNCAAYNDVDGAEAEPLPALSVNAFAVRSLARAAAEAGARLVHYSSDFVSSGEADAPYDEDARPAPKSTYAASKLLGEWFALDAPRSLVLRVESLFGSPRGWTGRRGTLDRIVAGLEAGQEVRVFTDRIVSPSYTVDVAAATRHLLSTDAPSGVYHCVNDGQASWHELACEVARLLDVTPRLAFTTMSDAHLKAQRPRFCALSTRKLSAAGFQMPTWRDALQRWIAVLGAASA